MPNHRQILPRRYCVPGYAAAWPIAWVGFLLAAAGMAPTPGHAQSPSSVEQGSTPLDEMSMRAPRPDPALGPVPAEREAKSPFIRDSLFSGQVRTFYFNREKYDDTHSEAWALGGSLGYQSGYLADRFRIGAVGYTSQPLRAPNDRDGTSLLKPRQKGYTVPGQIYGEVKLTERIFGAIGRKEYNTPYINANDVRMTPNTFEGVAAYGTAGGADGAPAWRFGGGYLSKIKQKNSDEFVGMSRAAGASVDRGVYLGGANFEHKGISIGAINYYSDDIINIFYTQGSFTRARAERYNLTLAWQYSDQRSTGEDLLTGRDFSTGQWGLKGELGLGAALFTVAYTDTANDADMRNPWSGHPGYTNLQVQTFARAGESAILVRAAYDFSRHGAEGVSTYAAWGHGAGRDAPAYDEDEVNFDLQWNPKQSALQGASFRLRYAHVAQRGGGDPTIDEIRLIVNANF